MKVMKLERLDKAEFDKLYEMKSEMMSFLDEKADFDNPQWMENLEAILEFQDPQGSFKLLSGDHIPSDARVDFCHEPTYICTAILMKACLAGNDEIFEKLECPLIDALDMCSLRNLSGHGYESLKGQIEALNIFMKGGLREFMDLHGEMSLAFSEMIQNIIIEFEEREGQNAFKGPWGEDYKKEILEISSYFYERQVFVYGTLMRGECNHHFLEKGEYIKEAAVDGYEMYNVGWFPAIVPGDGEIRGELYKVAMSDIPSIDSLEGEGSLYRRRCRLTSDNEIAYIYEYLDDTLGLERIDSWKRKDQMDNSK